MVLLFCICLLVSYSDIINKRTIHTPSKNDKFKITNSPLYYTIQMVTMFVTNQK